MSNRAMKKRRHRPDFQQYVELCKAEKEAMKKGDYATKAALYTAMAKAQLAMAKETAAQHEQEHIHGPECHHD